MIYMCNYAKITYMLHLKRKDRFLTRNMRMIFYEGLISILILYSFDLASFISILSFLFLTLIRTKIVMIFDVGALTLRQLADISFFSNSSTSLRMTKKDAASIVSARKPDFLCVKFCVCCGKNSRPQQFSILHILTIIVSDQFL